MMVEGVRYYRFRVRFTLADGRRRSWVRWSPGVPWVYGEIGRELYERFGLTGIKAKSCTIKGESISDNYRERLHSTRLV